MGGKRGDTFNGRGGSNQQETIINPDQPRWQDRIEWMLRALTGIDAVGSKIVVNVFDAAIGLVEDATASAALIAATPTTKATIVALNKALLLQSVAIKLAVDAVTAAIIVVEGKIDGTNTRLDAANTTLDEIATHLANILTDLATLQAGLNGLNTTADAIKTAVERVATPQSVSASGAQSITVSGQLAWVDWDANGAASAAMTINNGVGVIYTSLKLSGAATFNPPMPIGTYSISVVPIGGTTTIINAGVI